MDASSYITPRVEALTDHADEVYDVAPGVSNSFNTWSALKLILLSASVRMYTTVMGNQPIRDTYYIDALAGSGVSEYGDEEHFLGSSLLACRAARHPFSKMYFIEGNEDMATALEQRLDYVFQLPEFTEPKDWKVISGDCNEEIPRVVKDIRNRSDYREGFNYFAFIDNQGMDLEWSAIEKLTPTPHGDLLINLPTASAVGRNVGTTAANRFYGINTADIPAGDDIRVQLRRAYQSRLEERDRAVQTNTQVQADVGSYYYDLIYATRYIENGNDYMEVVRYVKSFIERMHSGNIDQILEVVRGDQEALDRWLPDDEPNEELMEELEEGDNGDQATFGDF